MLPLLTYDTICERSVRYRQELRIKRSYNVEKSFVPVGNELLQRIIRLQREVDRRGVEIALLRENLNSSGRNCRDASTNTDDSLFLDEPHYTFDRSRWSRIAINAKRRRLSPNSRSPKRPFTAPSRINSESEGFVDRTPVSPVSSIESDHNVELDSGIEHVPEKKLAEATSLDSTPAKIENENAGKVKVSPIRRAATSIRHYFKRITHPHVATVANDSPQEDFDPYKKAFETALVEHIKTITNDRPVIEKNDSRFKDDGIILHSSSSSSATPHVRSHTLQQLTQMLGIPTPTISAESKAEFARIQDNFKKMLNPTGEICEDESSRAEIVYEMYIPPQWPTIIISTDASQGNDFGLSWKFQMRYSALDSPSVGKTNRVLKFCHTSFVTK